MEIKALGEFVVLSATAKSAGSEIYSETIPGMVIGTRDTGEIPEVCFVHDIGPLVPKGIFNVGDMTPVPLGKMANIPHPLVATKENLAKDLDEKFFSVHYTNIPGLYVK